MTTVITLLRTLSLALCTCVVAACGNDTPPPSAADALVEPLPQPDPASGAVTDMPARPGPGEVPIAGEPPAPPPLFAADEHFGMPRLEDNPETGLSDPASAGVPAQDPMAEPTPADAVAVLRQYYAALAAGDTARAYGLWAGGGQASGQTLDQFSADFGQVATLDASVGEPGPIDAAAGTRQLEIPVTLRITRRDGSGLAQGGRVVLRRSVADGASPEQRAWRIASADIRDAAN